MAIKAKLDTGAKTSALHAWDFKVRKEDGKQWVRFRVHPRQIEKEKSVVCEAPIRDRRWVTNSSGMRELRYIIDTHLQIGSSCWAIELSLTNRESMGYPMIIGREAMRNRLIVDPRASYRAGRDLAGTLYGDSDDLDEPERGRVIK